MGVCMTRPEYILKIISDYEIHMRDRINRMDNFDDKMPWLIAIGFLKAAQDCMESVIDLQGKEQD